MPILTSHPPMPVRFGYENKENQANMVYLILANLVQEHCVLGLVLNVDKAKKGYRVSATAFDRILSTAKSAIKQVLRVEVALTHAGCVSASGPCEYHEMYDVEFEYILELEELVHMMTGHVASPDNTLVELEKEFDHGKEADGTRIVGS